MAMLVDADIEIFNRACFNYPTLGDLYQDACYDALNIFEQPASQNTITPA